MRSNGVTELQLETIEVPHRVPGLGRAFWAAAARPGLENDGLLGLLVVVLGDGRCRCRIRQRRKAICRPPELRLGRHRLVHSYVPRMTRQLYAQRYIQPRCACNRGEENGLGVSKQA